jgi:hypothetical protein
MGVVYASFMAGYEVSTAQHAEQKGEHDRLAKTRGFREDQVPAPKRGASATTFGSSAMNHSTIERSSEVHLRYPDSSSQRCQTLGALPGLENLR